METDRSLSKRCTASSLMGMLRSTFETLDYRRERQRFIQQLLERNRQLELSLESRCRNEAKLRRLSLLDSLTAIYNRRGFDEALEREWQCAMRAQQPLSLIMIDIDFFKAFNDCYGHPVGDSCLKQVARGLHRSLKRPADLVARYGGEEFGVILPNTCCAGAILIGEELRQQIIKLAIPHKCSSASKWVTISAGLATIYPVADSEQSSQGLLAWADRALYAAKASGRDRLEIFAATKGTGGLANEQPVINDHLQT